MSRLRCAAFSAAAVLVGLMPARMNAQAPVAPPAAIAAARAAANDTARGAPLQVLLVTIGQGDPVWERFGHNMLWIRNERTGEERAWNWGIFSFEDPMFVPRFLFGRTHYMMDSTCVRPTKDCATAQDYLNHYQQTNREVIVQELALTAGQRAALDAFLLANADTANKFYRYDYYRDNCSTRLRDALDIVLGGAIRNALEPLSDAPISYRSESLRLNANDPWIFLGMDFALGAPADRPLDPWKAAFVPMRLRDALRRVWVKAEDGTSVPLVKKERVLIASDRPAELADLAIGKWPQRVMIGTFVLTLLVVGVGVLARRGVGIARPMIVTFAVAIHVVFGLFAALLLFMWLFTLHWAWAWNVHLLMFTPASLVIAVQVIRRRKNWKAGNWIEGYHLVMAGISFALVAGVLLWYRQWLTPAGALVIMWANVSWMLHFALGSALARLPAVGRPA